MLSSEGSVEQPAGGFERVRVRTAVLLVLGVGAVVALAQRALGAAGALPVPDALASLAFQLAAAGALLGYLRRRRVSPGRLVGPAPRDARSWALVAMAAPLLLLSLGSAALLFSLLAAAAPSTVAALSGAAGDAAPAAGTAAVLIQAAAGVAGAAMEELLFRGVMLTRWERRWGARRAAVASSLAFALLHVDPVGAFTFGLVMCLLYLRTGSLWVPFACHALNNAVVSLSDLGSASGTVAGASAADLAPDWKGAALAIALAAPILVWFFRRYWPGSWRLPYDAPR